jgi:hypothetical protein
MTPNLAKLLSRRHEAKYKGYTFKVFPGIDTMAQAPWQVEEAEEDFVVEDDSDVPDENLWYLTKVPDEYSPSPLGDSCCTCLMFDSAAVREYFEEEGPFQPDEELRDGLLAELGREPTEDDYLDEHVWKLYVYYREYVQGQSPWLMIEVQVCNPDGEINLTATVTYRQIAADRFDEIWKAAVVGARQEIDSLISEN